MTAESFNSFITKVCMSDRLGNIAYLELDWDAKVIKNIRTRIDMPKEEKTKFEQRSVMGS